MKREYRYADEFESHTSTEKVVTKARVTMEKNL